MQRRRTSPASSATSCQTCTHRGCKCCRSLSLQLWRSAVTSSVQHCSGKLPPRPSALRMKLQPRQRAGWTAPPQRQTTQRRCPVAPPFWRPPPQPPAGRSAATPRRRPPWTCTWPCCAAAKASCGRSPARASVRPAKRASWRRWRACRAWLPTPPCSCSTLAAPSCWAPTLRPGWQSARCCTAGCSAPMWGWTRPCVSGTARVACHTCCNGFATLCPPACVDTGVFPALFFTHCTPGIGIHI